VDVYDALRTARPYKTPLSLPKTLGGDGGPDGSEPSA
jgi:hypothetical protein